MTEQLVTEALVRPSGCKVQNLKSRLPLGNLCFHEIVKTKGSPRPDAVESK